MGNDGGTIPRRTEILAFSGARFSGAHSPSSNTHTAHSQPLSLAYCRLSNHRLASPLVSDYLGRLYNKEAVLEHLLAPASSPAAGQCRWIRSLKDVVALRIDYDAQKRTIACPVSSRTFHLDNDAEAARVQLCYFVPCGCTVCCDVWQQMQGSQHPQDPLDHSAHFPCPVCGTPTAEDNVIPINPGPEDVARLEARMRRLRARGLTHSLKKAKQAKQAKSAKHAKKGTSKGTRSSKSGKIGK